MERQSNPEAAKYYDQAQSILEHGDGKNARIIMVRICQDYPDSLEATAASQIISEIDLNKHGRYGKPKAVAITGIDIPFGSLVNFLMKLALAAIPAGIFVAIFYFFIALVLAGMGLGGSQF